MGIAQFNVTNELLVDLIGLPEGTKIVACGVVNDQDMIRIVVDNEDLDDVPKGSSVPFMLPTWDRVNEWETVFEWVKVEKKAGQ